MLTPRTSAVIKNSHEHCASEDLRAKEEFLVLHWSEETVSSYKQLALSSLTILCKEIRSKAYSP